MQDGGFLAQFLYLLVYSSSIICAAAVIVFNKRLGEAVDKPLRRMIIAVAFTSTMMSAQVFLNAAGLLERLAETNASRIIITINILIAAGIAALVYSAAAMTFTLRPGGFSKQLQNITAVLIAAVLLNTTTLQILTLFLHSLPASELLGYTMIGGIVLFIVSMAFSTIRLFIPLKQKDDNPLMKQIRIMLLCLAISPVLLLLSGSLVGVILAPAGFIGLNILGLRILYLRLNDTDQRSPYGEKADEDSVDPAENCRELGLSKRETEVALLLSAGKAYKEISAGLFISMSTTQTHVGRIYTKLGINNKTELSNLLYYKK